MEAMTIPAGYKRTEAGVIPSDWDLFRMDNICDVRDGTHESPKYYDNGVIFITSKNIVNGKIDFSNVNYISKEDAFDIDKRSKVDKGDILMSMIGTIGNCVLVDFEPNFCIKNIALFKPEKIEGSFLVQLLFSQFYQSYIKSKLEGGIQKFISLGVLRSLDIPLPPTLEEQRAIAAALSDADALISSLERLIAKKRSIKQGAMQVLLQPQAGWEVKRLGEMGTFKNGINKSSEDFGFGYPFVNLLDIFGRTKLSTKNQFGLINSNEMERKIYDLRRGDVLFVRSSVKPEGVGVTCVIEENLDDTVFSGFVIRFRDNGFLSNEFKEHCFYTIDFRNRLIANSTVSANTNINQESLKNLTLSFPKSKTEQARIARILADMDAEIEALEQKLAKCRLLKQGMMQQLLTGKIRLPH